MIRVKQVDSKREMKIFARFNYEMYKGNQYFAPELYEDVLGTFSPKSNAALEFCETACFLAYNDVNEVVGRVAAIVNNKANAAWNVKNVRFGWIDFIDDKEVSAALLKAVEEWGRERGMDHIQGPLGFTDFDPEGMLIEGFDEKSTLATIYNYPYYPEHMTHHGFEKEADWIEWNIKVPTEVPERISRIANLVQKKYDLRIAPRCSTRKYLAKYGSSFFDCVNAAFKPLFGYSELSERQKKDYLDMYTYFLDTRFISIVLDKDDRVVAAGVAIPNMTEALQKSKGKLLPLGWIPILKALKWKMSNTCDLMIAAVLPEYQGKGLNALFINDLIYQFNKAGFRMVESNPELELNEKVQSQWIYFDRRIAKRRRCFVKKI